MSSRLKPLPNSFKELKKWKSWKKSTQLIALIVLLVGIYVTVVLVKNFALYLSRAAAAEIFFSPSPLNLPPNSTMNLMIDLKDNTQVVFAQVEFSFDRTKINLTGEITSPNNFLTTVVRKTSMSEANLTGQISIVLALPPGSAYPSGVIEFVKIPLGAVTSQTTQTSLTVNTQAIQIVDVSGGTPHEVAVTVQPNTINLNPVSATNTPTTRPPTATPTRAPLTSTPTPTIPGVTSTPTPPISGTLFTPVADSYVSGNFTAVNFGGSSTLQVDNIPEVKIAYLRFDLSSLAGKSAVKAVLRLRVNDSSAAGSIGTQFVKSVADNSWKEFTINYVNKPALGSAVGVLNGGTAGSFVEVDVTSYVNQYMGGLISFGIDQEDEDGIIYYSKEFSTASLRPALIVEAGGPPPPTSTPTKTPTPTAQPSPSAPPVPPDTTLSFTPSALTTNVGSTFTLDIMINTGQNSVVGADLYINFDRTRLQAIDIVPGTFFATPREELKNLNNSTGLVTYSLHTPPETQAVRGSGVFARITFKAIATGTANISWSTLTAVGAVNMGGTNALKSATGAVITINPAASIPGDINIYVNGICGDGVVNILDYGVLFDNYGEAPTDHPCADINRDGRVNILDYVILFENWGRTA